MSLVQRIEPTHGSAKIIPFPVVHATTPRHWRIAPWARWLLLLGVASIIGEIGSSWLSRTAVQQPIAEQNLVPSRLKATDALPGKATTEVAEKRQKQLFFKSKEAVRHE